MSNGVRHWWLQRVSSIALVPLSIWFVVSLIALPLSNHAVLVDWLSHSWNTLLLLLFALVATWHSQLGVRVVIEDYVHTPGLNTFALLASTAAHVLIAVAVIYAVLKIAL